jgi:hypothetical protein
MSPNMELTGSGCQKNMQPLSSSAVWTRTLGLHQGRSERRQADERG